MNVEKNKNNDDGFYFLVETMSDGLISRKRVRAAALFIYLFFFFGWSG